MSLLLALILTTTVVQQPGVERELPVEVFQVIELPVTITDSALIKTKNGYLLKCVLANNSESRLVGLRYALTLVDSMNVAKIVVARNEGLRLAQNQIKNVSFRTPIKLKLKPGERLVLMLEQVFSPDYMWDVMNSKEALAAYIAGDYSVAPRVLRLHNQVDTPPRPRIIY